jgi:hypothetical protein
LAFVILIILASLFHSLSFISGIKEEEEKARSQLVLPYITEEQKSGEHKAVYQVRFRI